MAQSQGGSSIKNDISPKIGSTPTENRSGSNSPRVPAITGPKAASGGNITKSS